MTEPVDGNNRKRVLAALLLGKPEQPNGSRPSHEELWDWIHGDVPDARSRQIRQHIAQDEDLYEDWRELRLAASESSTQSTLPAPAKSTWTQRIHSLLSNLTTLAPASVAGSVVVIVVALGIGLQLRHSQNELDFWQEWQYSKGTSISTPNDTLLHSTKTVLAGMHLQLDELSLPTTGPEGQPLPGSAPECLDNASCLQLRNTLISLGHLLVKGRHDCLSGASDLAAVQNQAGVLIQDLVDQDPASAFLSPLRLWTNAAADDITSQCAAIESLIARALSGL